MAARSLPLTSDQAARLLLAIQAGDAVACAIPLPVTRDELERLGCPPWMQRTIPVVKGASVVGLLAGRRRPGLGRVTTDALVAYFVCALAAHGLVRDPAWRWGAAAGMLGLTLVARRAYRDEPVIDLTTEDADDEVIDLTASPAPEAAVTAHR
jgi:hypothetical protein